VIFLAASGALAVAGPVSGWLGERFDVPRLMATANLAGAAGLLVVAAGPGLAVYVLGLLVFGTGYGLSWALTSVGTQTVVPTEKAGEASGVTLAIVVGMAGLCVAVAAALIETSTGGGTTQGEAIKEQLRYLAIGSGIAAIALGLVRGAEAPRGSLSET
jgi:MFS family permease